MNLENINIQLSIDPDEPNRSVIRSKLRQYNQEKAAYWPFIKQQSSLTITVKDDCDNIIAGLFGDASLGCFYIKILWIKQQYRCQGLGTKLMQTVEKEAKKNNCCVIMVDTMDFQAPRFYFSLGYQQFGEFKYADDGPTRHFFKKYL